MFTSTWQPFRWLMTTPLRSYSSKQDRPVPSRMRFYMDTKAVYGPQQTVVEKRSPKPSELDLCLENPKKKVFENETALLYGPETEFRRVCSVPKGVSIAERKKYLRDLFRIPRGHRASLYPQAYIPNKYLGSRKKKEE